jgi:hypothetical protein
MRFYGTCSYIYYTFAQNHRVSLKKADLRSKSFFFAQTAFRFAQNLLFSLKVTNNEEKNWRGTTARPAKSEHKFGIGNQLLPKAIESAKTALEKSRLHLPALFLIYFETRF